MRVPVHKCDQCETRVLRWMPVKGTEGRVGTVEELREHGWQVEDGRTLCPEHKKESDG